MDSGFVLSPFSLCVSEVNGDESLGLLPPMAGHGGDGGLGLRPQGMGVEVESLWVSAEGLKKRG